MRQIAELPIFVADAAEEAGSAWLARVLRTHIDHPSSVDTGDERAELPPVVQSALRALADYFADGRPVAIVPLDAFMSTQGAADLLQISRPSMVALLERGALPFVRVGAHRRVRAADVYAYRRARFEQRQRALDAVDAIVQVDSECL